MRALLFGTYDTSLHPRIATIAEGLRAHGIDVAECNAPLGLDTAARVEILARPWRVPVLLARLARRWTALARAARRLPAPDVVLIGYLGHFDVHLARLLFRRTPLVLDHLIGAVERRGYTLVPLELYWKAGRAKLLVGLAKGKKQHDKRATDKDRDWQRDKSRIMKAMRR